MIGWLQFRIRFRWVAGPPPKPHAIGEDAGNHKRQGKPAPGKMFSDISVRWNNAIRDDNGEREQDNRDVQNQPGHNKTFWSSRMHLV